MEPEARERAHIRWRERGEGRRRRLQRRRRRVYSKGPEPPRTGALPNLVVIGAQKCGTSGLHYHLGLHPEVAMSEPKELNFFIRKRNWERGIDWYASHFDPVAKVRGESSPNYTAYPQHRKVPRRMCSVIPDAKLIYVVRDPLERIASHWVHNYAKQRERGGLAETLMRRRATYITRSQYHLQLRQFLRFYPKDQILVLDQEDLLRDRHASLRGIFEFVGVDPDFSHPRFTRELHRSERKSRPTRLGNRVKAASRTSAGRMVPERFWNAVSRLPPLRTPIARPDVRGALPDEAIALLREDAERLSELTGRTFDHWSIWK